jgi:hypothetical protein
MATVDQTIDSALRMVSLIGPGHSASSGSSGLRTAAIDILNAMLGAWALDGINVPCETVTEFTATGGDGEYTVGSGGDIDITRPNRVRCSWKADDVERPLAELGDREFQQWGDKTSEGSPVAFHYKNAAPLGTLTLLPVPDESETLVLYVKERFTTYSSGSTTVNLPDFDEAIRCNLALRFLAELFSLGAKMSPDVLMEVKERARNGKADIRRMGSRIPSIESDFGKRGGMTEAEFESGWFLR